MDNKKLDKVQINEYEKRQQAINLLESWLQKLNDNEKITKQK
jgi:hypothetical protein